MPRPAGWPYGRAECPAVRRFGTAQYNDRRCHCMDIPGAQTDCRAQEATTPRGRLQDEELLKAPPQDPIGSMCPLISSDILLGSLVRLLHSQQFYDLAYQQLPFRLFPLDSQVTHMRAFFACVAVLVVSGAGAVFSLWFRLHWRALMPLSFRYAWVLKAVFVVASAFFLSAILISPPIAGVGLFGLTLFFQLCAQCSAWLGNTWGDAYYRVFPYIS